MQPLLLSYEAVEEYWACLPPTRQAKFQWFIRCQSGVRYWGARGRLWAQLRRVVVSDIVRREVDVDEIELPENFSQDEVDGFDGWQNEYATEWEAKHLRDNFDDWKTGYRI